MVSRDSKVDNFAISLFFFLLIIIWSALLVEIQCSVCMSKSNRSLYLLFCRTDTGLFIYHLLVWSNFNFWHISLCITLPAQSCLVLYSFSANSLIMWLMVSSLSLHILALIWLVLKALFSAAIRRDSVSLLKFPFLSHVQILLYEMFYYYQLFTH